MPYIPKDRREAIVIDGEVPGTQGELNFVLTHAVNAYLNRVGLRYETINDVMGALECAKTEFYRRVAAPYEDAKRVVNGDAYSEAFVSPREGLRATAMVRR